MVRIHLLSKIREIIVVSRNYILSKTKVYKHIGEESYLRNYPLCKSIVYIFNIKVRNHPLLKLIKLITSHHIESLLIKCKAGKSLTPN